MGDTETAAGELLEATIERAYVDMQQPGGYVDLVLVAAEQIVRLPAASLRLTTSDRWNQAVTYDDCQRWLVGARITHASHAGRPSGLTLTLDNGVMVSSISL